MAIEWSGSDQTPASVAPTLFGTNMLFDRDAVGETGTFDDVIDTLNIGHVRWPGGSITEWYFDITDPDATRVWAPDREAWREVMPLSEFLTWAGEADVGVTLVIPTANLLTDGPLGTRGPKATAYDDIYTYVTDVLTGTYGAARIDAFEMGNEFWLGAEMNAVEYSRITNLMAVAIQDAIDDVRVAGDRGPDWQEPDIVVQIGQYGAYSPIPGHIQNPQLISWVTPEAAAAIDAVTVHYYTRGGWDDLATFGYYFDRLNEWTFDPRFTDIDFYVTEWNVNNQLSTEFGLRQASALWYMFAEMVLQGVDAAHIWPVQQNNRTSLSGNEGQTDLTIAGEAYRLLSDVLVGADLVNQALWSDGAAWVYENGAATHVYIVSQSDTAETFALDAGDLGLEGQTWWTTTLGTLGATDDPHADPVLEVRADTAGTDGTDGTDGTIAFALDPYEVVRATFYASEDPGLVFPDALTGSASGDRIAASDLGNRIDSRAGDDVITGGAGRDVIDAGAGRDSVEAGAGHDRVLLGDGDDVFDDGAPGTESGSDKVFGGAGDDTIFGRSGSDRLKGDSGDDMLWGGTGDDVLLGNRGADLLYGDAGHDELDGGPGADTLSGGTGNDTLAGADGEDMIAGDAGRDILDGAAGDDSLAGGTGDDLLVGGEGHDRLDGGDGADTLSGGDGDDLLIGAAGADLFVFDRDDGHDTIQGFTEEDMIDLRGRGGSAYHEIKIEIEGDSATLQIAGTWVTITGLEADLDKSDFLYG